MAITHAHTYLVYPGKASNSSITIDKNTVALSGDVYTLLRDIYDRSDSECNIDILFNVQNSTQQNDCRDLFVGYLSKPSLPAGEKIALRLYEKTDKRSGIGLLFLIAGQEGPKHKLMLARFPTNTGVLAEAKKGGLNVKFLKRIFMRSSKSYKAVAYKATAISSQLWSGKAVDRQINNPLQDISNYWIHDFLDSTLKVTGAAGTMRLAKVLRHISTGTADLSLKAEIRATAVLARGLKGQKLSVDDFIKKFSLSDEAATEIQSRLNPDILREKFAFDDDEFGRHIGLRSVALDNGAILTADNQAFEKVFRSHRAADAPDETVFTTRGRIVDEFLSKAKAND